MSAVFVDTAVIMYAAGRDHPLRASCTEVMRRVGVGSIEGVISTEVIQEILHRYSARGEPDRARSIARDAIDVFTPLLPVTHSIAMRACDLHERYRVRARDLFHVATCLEEGIDTIVSPDAHFDEIREIRRLDPADAAAPTR